MGCGLWAKVGGCEVHWGSFRYVFIHRFYAAAIWFMLSSCRWRECCLCGMVGASRVAAVGEEVMCSGEVGGRYEV